MFKFWVSFYLSWLKQYCHSCYWVTINSSKKRKHSFHPLTSCMLYTNIMSIYSTPLLFIVFFLTPQATSVRSSFPAWKALRVNSPASAGLMPDMLPEKTHHTILKMCEVPEGHALAHNAHIKRNRNGGWNLNVSLRVQPKWKHVKLRAREKGAVVISQTFLRFPGWHKGQRKTNKEVMVCKLLQIK